MIHRKNQPIRKPDVVHFSGQMKIFISTIIEISSVANYLGKYRSPQKNKNRNEIGNLENVRIGTTFTMIMITEMLPESH